MNTHLNIRLNLLYSETPVFISVVFKFKVASVLFLFLLHILTFALTWK